MPTTSHAPDPTETAGGAPAPLGTGDSPGDPALFGPCATTDADAVTTVLAADPDSAAAARDLLARTLDGWGMGELAEDGMLAISEVVTNVWRHTDAPVVPVTIIRAGTDVEVCVANTTMFDGPVQGRAGRRALADGPGGFGLRIVEQLADTCGWVRTAVGAAYRFTLAARP